eukprot:14187584-Alexandrium_andersonii.AAC.1
MSASLVGSEMCIRDSLPLLEQSWLEIIGYVHVHHGAVPVAALHVLLQAPVSYTHLTLPTICSV